MSTETDQHDGAGALFTQTRASNGGRSVWRIAAQLVGFLAGLGLLGWCVRLAFAPENRAQIDRLLDASPGQILAMLGLSVLVMIINGLIFWIVLRPAARLRASDVVATNAVATFLGYLPFKLGMFMRIMIHNRRDRVALVTITAWLAAWAGAVVLACAPMALVAFLRPTVDVLWVALVVLGMAVGVGITVAVARRYRGERGEARLRGWATRLRLGIAHRVMDTAFFATAHAGLEMLCDPRTLGGACLLRGVDMAVQAARFLVAAWVLGVELAPGEAMLVAVAYFVIGAVSPIGMLGSREAGVLALATLLGLGHLAGAEPGPEGGAGGGNMNTLAVLALFVTGTETVAYLACAGVGAAWLRIDRLLLRGSWHATGDPDQIATTRDGSGANDAGLEGPAGSDQEH